VQEFLIAIAGPLFNFFVVFAIALLVSAFPQIPWPWELFNPDTITIEGFEAALATNLLFAFFWINFMLGAFNLFFPALPMDGGRVLRSLLAMKFGNSRATHIATAISRFLSIALFIFGLFTFNVLIMLIAGLLYFSAGAENQMADTKDVLMGVSVAQIAKPITGTLPKEMTVSQAYLALSELNKTRALVNLSGSLGYVDIEMFSKIQKIKWQVVLLSDIAVPLKAMPIEFDALQFFMFSMSSGQPFIPVIKDGAVSSYVDIDDLMSLYSLRKALPR
jgi:hypothetical protein